MTDNALVAPGSDDKVPAWIGDHITAERCFLLAHADDGVIWGRWNDDQQRLVTAHEAADGSSAAPLTRALNGETLQQAFLFGAHDEVRLFRIDGTWQVARLIDSETMYLPESTIVVGSRVKTHAHLQLPFTHIYDPVQRGLDHIVPLQVDEEPGLGFESGEQQVRLLIHHLLVEDRDTGEMRIGGSRLVNLYLGDQ